ncbi:hypothetical protein LCGC14_3116480 [marine sediment metagenome]|uniref:Uncharacterized protein n=1 Tax=marine sediment metagenome TaxID=412755 RepID=A0A0F8W3W9_9ZZZZ
MLNELLTLAVENWHIFVIAAWAVFGIGGTIWVTRNLTDEERARFPYL